MVINSHCPCLFQSRPLVCVSSHYLSSFCPNPSLHGTQHSVLNFSSCFLLSKTSMAHGVGIREMFKFNSFGKLFCVVLYPSSLWLFRTPNITMTPIVVFVNCLVQGLWFLYYQIVPIEKSDSNVTSSSKPYLASSLGIISSQSRFPLRRSTLCSNSPLSLAHLPVYQLSILILLYLKHALQILGISYKKIEWIIPE